MAKVTSVMLSCTTAATEWTDRCINDVLEKAKYLEMADCMTLLYLFQIYRAESNILEM